MITAGIDIGAKTIKVVVLKDSVVVSQAIKVAGLDGGITAKEVFDVALKEAGVTRSDVKMIIATGSGRDIAPDKDSTITEVDAAARGAFHLFPDARTLVDVGAEEGRVICCNEKGKVVDFTVNEKCAAGAGAFIEAMARALEVSLADFGPLSLKSTKSIPMNAQCVVFAESEVVSMIHSNIARQDIARSVHDAMASRIVSMVCKIGYSSPLVLIGGLAKNIGFVESLKRGLKIEEIKIPNEPEYCSALGAALVAVDNGYME